MRVGETGAGSPPEQFGSIRRAESSKDGTSFNETFFTFLNDVNTAQKISGEAQSKLLSGETADVHQVMTKSEEAKVAFNMLMELRNKTMEGYQEIMRIRL